MKENQKKTIQTEFPIQAVAAVAVAGLAGYLLWRKRDAVMPLVRSFSEKAVSVANQFGKSVATLAASEMSIQSDSSAETKGAAKENGKSSKGAGNATLMN